MRILITVHHYLDVNAGAAGSTLHLAQQYREQGHDVEVFAFDDLPPSYSLRSTQISFPFWVARQIWTLARRDEIDLVDASTGDAWVWALMARARRNRPTLITRSTGLEHTAEIHNAEIRNSATEPKGTGIKTKIKAKITAWRTRWRLHEVALSLRFSDNCIFLNRRDRDYAVRKLRVRKKRAHVVGNGVSQEFLNLGYQKPEAQTLPRVAVIGSFLPRKGIAYSTEALNTLMGRYPELEVSFLGTGCREAEVLQRFDAAFHSRVRIVPSYTNAELPALLQHCHIQIFASLFEGFGKTLLEGMACGLVPVTSACEGALEFVRDGENGLVVPCACSDAIVEAVERLLADRPLLTDLRDAAYQTAQQFSWKAIRAAKIGRLSAGHTAPPKLIFARLLLLRHLARRKQNLL